MQITSLRDQADVSGFRADPARQKTRPPAQYDANDLASPGH
jgi:hypothetical protein